MEQFAAYGWGQKEYFAATLCMKVDTTQFQNPKRSDIKERVWNNLIILTCVFAPDSMITNRCVE
jgi:hypothetical protein